MMLLGVDRITFQTPAKEFRRFNQMNEKGLIFLPGTKRAGPGCSWTSVRSRSKVCIRHRRMNVWSSSAPGVVDVVGPSRLMLGRLGVIRTSSPYKCRSDGP
jgi:hypothetical protein